MHDFQVVLLVGKPGDSRLAGLLEHFEEEALLTVLHRENLEDVFELLPSAWPDLICVFADELEAAGEDGLAFCQRLRELQLKYRPVLVVQSGGLEPKRIQYLMYGADDVFGPDLSLEEFKIRLLVHLRRNLDLTANEMTQLPGLHFTGKVIERRLRQDNPLSILLVELDHFDVYSEVYGELPARQVMKTFAALLGRLIIMPDFISHTDENNFVVVTTPERAEKIAALLCRQFETVSPNFYSEKDRKQDYMISVLSGNISRRVPLMTLSIGIAGTQTQPFASFLPLFNAAQQMKTLARMTPANSWQSDRLRLAGPSDTGTPQQKPGILVLETDAALAYLLKTTLQMEGFAVDVVSGVDDAHAILDRSEPAGLQLLILDALIHDEESGLLLAREVHSRFPGIRIICTSSLHNRQRVLQAGVDLYLPKPFELSSLFLWIHRLLQESN
jgi:DNA-binding response OmpR family regulator